MKISIITATYNSEKTIKHTLNSVLEQNYKNIEHIIVDGLSSDDTLNIIHQSSNNICKIISEKDKGIFDALNKGIAHASGDVIGFLHSDDFFASNDAVTSIINQFKNTNTDAVYGDLEYVSNTDINKVIRHWKSGSYHKNKLKNGWMPPHPTFYMRREIYQQLGGFNLNYQIAGDYESILRYLFLNNISVSYCPKTLVKMRTGGISNRNLKSIMLKTLEDMRAMKSVGLFVPQAIVMKNLTKVCQFFKKSDFKNQPVLE